MGHHIPDEPVEFDGLCTACINSITAVRMKYATHEFVDLIEWLPGYWAGDDGDNYYAAFFCSGSVGSYFHTLTWENTGEDPYVDTCQITNESCPYKTTCGDFTIEVDY